MTDTLEKNQEAISDWVGDIVALVGHIEEALDHQLKLDFKSPAVGALIRELHDTVRDEKKRAVAFQESIGSTSGNPVIKVGSELLGKAAGMIDRWRNDSSAKSLRDDYTALNHLVMSYSMLHTTSMALQHDEARSFAEQGIRTVAALVQKINSVIPDAVVQELVDNDQVEVLDPDVVAECRAEIDRIWKETSQ